MITIRLWLCVRMRILCCWLYLNEVLWLPLLCTHTHSLSRTWLFSPSLWGWLSLQRLQWKGPLFQCTTLLGEQVSDWKGWWYFWTYAELCILCIVEEYVPMDSRVIGILWYTPFTMLTAYTYWRASCPCIYPNSFLWRKHTHAGSFSLSLVYRAWVQGPSFLKPL